VFDGNLRPKGNAQILNFHKGFLSRDPFLIYVRDECKKVDQGYGITQGELMKIV
jgi:hypothetical protein